MRAPWQWFKAALEHADVHPHMCTHIHTNTYACFGAAATITCNHYLKWLQSSSHPHFPPFFLMSFVLLFCLFHLLTLLFLPAIVQHNTDWRALWAFLEIWSTCVRVYLKEKKTKQNKKTQNASIPALLVDVVPLLLSKGPKKEADRIILKQFSPLLLHFCALS